MKDFYSRMRKVAEDMIHSGVSKADGEKLVRGSLDVHGSSIDVEGQTYPLEEYEEILLFGIGKASVPLAFGMKGLEFDDGLIITAQDTEEGKCPVEVREGSHPYPEEENVRYSRELLEKLAGSRRALIFFLVSGGGSSLFTIPDDDIDIGSLNDLNRALVNSGADIKEINCVRKHVSRVKGGRFAEFCQEKGTLVSLILSDVVGDDLGSIASGPTYPDDTTYREAIDVLQKYDIWESAPAVIRDHLQRGQRGKIPETPGETRATNILIGSNESALEGAKREAEEHGLPAVILSSQNEGEAKHRAKEFMARAKEIQDTGKPFEPPVALVIGGEMTVAMGSDESSRGEGGPNREFVLSSAVEISGRNNIVVASVDTDGVDGKGEAGAIADCETLKNCDLDPEEYLSQHRSGEFFDMIDSSLDFESRTNVNDLTVIIIGESR